MNLLRRAKSQRFATGAALLCVTSLSVWGLAGGAIPPITGLAAQSAATSAQIYEVRVYRINPGMMDGFVKFMGEKLVPYEERMGMQMLGHFVAEEENTYVWIRTYPDMETQARISDEMHATAEWRESIAPEVGQYIDKIEVFFTTPTYYSNAK